MSIDQLERPVVERQQQPRSTRRPWLATAAAMLIVGAAVALFASLGGQLGPEDRPESLRTAVLGAHPETQTYFARSVGEFDAAVMGVEPGTVTAEWYRAEGHLVVFFAGLDTAATGGLCPSAYVKGTGGPDHMANAPAAGADCSALVVHGLADPAVSALECNGSLALRTAIPEDADGAVFATLERPVETPSGGTGIMGLLAMSLHDPGSVPEVDLSLFEC